MTRKSASRRSGCSTGLAIEVVIPKHVDSGRAQISKGLLRDARSLAIRNVELLKDVVTSETPMVGIEPSAILGFRDEVPDLVPERLVEAANALAKHALLIDEFIAREADSGRIRRGGVHKRASQYQTPRPLPPKVAGFAGSHSQSA